MEKVLNKINNPEDLKKLTIEEMNYLAYDIREAILNRVSNIGGHVGSNLGIVEMTIAMHYVFNSPIDKIIFDVSHQCYAHKILTGRKNGFINKEDFYKISGYTNPEESKHDIFKIGHTSTSVSLACGLAKARDLKNEKYNIIAVIGDGALSGGESFEGLNNAAELNSNLIILVNDNDMSIAENHGGIYKNLKLLRETNGKAECNFFKALGLEYYYVNNGNNIKEIIETLKKVKGINKPVVVHINTLKGKGLKYAEEDKETWHFNAPFDILTGKAKNDVKEKSKTYQEITAEYLLEKSKEDKNLVVVTPAVPGVCGFTKDFRNKLGEKYIDVGIAEEHSIAFASGMAKQGIKVVLGMHSSFIQRTYDQLSQDLAMNNSPVVILVFKNGITPSDITHSGAFDIPLISNIPNIVQLAPTCLNEYMWMLEWSINQNKYPVVIKVPNDEVKNIDCIAKSDYSELNKYEIINKGKDVVILALGKFFTLGQKVENLLSEKYNIKSTLINPRFITGIDKNTLDELKKDHKIVVTIEDGILDGGFGEKIARYYGAERIKVLNYGAKKEFTDRVTQEKLYDRYRLNVNQIVEDILKSI